MWLSNLVQKTNETFGGIRCALIIIIIKYFEFCVLRSTLELTNLIGKSLLFIADTMRKKQDEELNMKFIREENLSLSPVHLRSPDRDIFSAKQMCSIFAVRSLLLSSSSILDSSR